MATGGNGGGSGAIRAGGAFVELMTKDEGLVAGLKKAEAMVANFASKIATAATFVGGIGASILEPLQKLFWGATDYSADVGKMAAKWGTSAKDMSRFAYAAKMSGTGLEELDGILVQFSRHVEDAASGSRESAEAFARAGLDAAALAQQSPIDQMLAFADAMKNTANATERFALEAKLGGRGMTELDSLLRGGRAGIEAKMAKASAIGAEVTNEQAAAAGKIKAAWKEAAAAIEFAWQSLGAALIIPLMGPIKEAAAAITRVAIAVRGFIVRNKELVLAVFAVGAALTAVAGILTAWAAATAVISTILSPIGLIVGAVAAAAGALGGFLLFSETGRGIVARLGDAVKEMWRGIGDALMSGDLETAGAIAFAGLKAVFYEALAGLTRVWNSFKAEIVDGWHEVAYAAKWSWVQVAGVFDSEEERVKEIAELKKRADADQLNRTASRQYDVDVLKGAANASWDERERLIAEAAEKAKPKPPPRADVAARVQAVAAQMQAVIANSRGSFLTGGNAGGVFGAATGVAEKQLRVQEKIGKDVGVIAQELKKDRSDKFE